MLSVRILLAALGLFSAPPLAAQTRFDPGSAPGRPLREAFERTYADRSLAEMECRVGTFPAQLGYDLQISAGFEFLLPLRQFQGKNANALVNVFRVTPRKPAGEPVWFIRRWPLRPIPEGAAVDKRLSYQFSGGFLGGPGEYDVDWLPADGPDPGCPEGWSIKGRAPRAGGLDFKPGLVDDDRRLLNWSGPAAASSARRATIFLNAAPTVRRRYSTRLSWWDFRLLLTTLTNAIGRGGFTQARVVVFDLERRRVLFEADDFRRREFRELAEVLGAVDLATIDYATLARGPSEWEFLESLLAAERKQSVRPDAYLFIAPAWREGERRRPLNPALLEDLPRVFAFALAPFGQYASGTVVDFAKAARGRVFNIFQPPGLATATERLRRELDGEER